MSDIALFPILRHFPVLVFACDVGRNCQIGKKILLVRLSAKSADRQKYTWRKVEACSYNHCSSGTGISITYSECGFVALIIQHAVRMSFIFFVCGLCLSNRAVLQIGISLVRSQLVSVEFSLTKSFRSHYGPGVDSASNRNEYKSISWG